MTLPVFGTSYAIAAAYLFWYGWRHKTALLRPLGALALAISAMNLYVEEWEKLKVLNFEASALVLLFGFLGAQTAVSLRLMEQVGVTNRRAAFVAAFLPVLFVLALAFVAVLPTLKARENPAFAFYLFVVFLSVLQLPLFAAGKDKVKRSDKLTPWNTSFHYPSKETLLVVLGPLLILFLIQVAFRSDWRFFGSNVVLCAAIASLICLGHGAKMDRRDAP